MRKLKCSDNQILASLKPNKKGGSVPDLCLEHGMISAQFYNWWAKFGGMDASLMKRLKEFEDGNKRLKKCMQMSDWSLRSVRKPLRESCNAPL